MNEIIQRLDYALDKVNAPQLKKGRQGYLAQLTGNTTRTIRRWYADKSIPLAKIHDLAKTLQINPKWLETGKGCYRAIPDHIKLQDNEAIIPILSWNDISQWLSHQYVIDNDKSEYRKVLLSEMSEDSFILITELADLEPYISVGSLVFIDPNQTPNNHDYILIDKYDGVKPIIRRYTVVDNNILLVSPAPNIPTTKLTNYDSILGVIKQHTTPHH